MLLRGRVLFYRCFLSHNLGSRFNGFAYARVGATAADVSLHGNLDVLIRWIAVAFEQSSRCHNLARLAVTTLGYLLFYPRLLYRVRVIGGDAFDGCYVFSGCCRYRHGARPDGIAVEVHCAGSALGYATSVLGSGKSCQIANGPQQRHSWIGIYGESLFVDF